MAYTSPSTWAAAAVLTAAQLNQQLRDNMLAIAGTTGTIVTSALPSSWTSFTPTLTQGAGITITITFAEYMLLGKTAIVQMTLTCSSAGTGGSTVAVASLPAAIAPSRTDSSAHGGLAGFFQFFDTSASTNYAGTSQFTSTTALALVANAGVGLFGASPAVTIASGDQVAVQLVYRVA